VIVTLLGAAVFIALSAWGFIENGFGGLLLVAGILGAVTAGYAFALGRPSWARFPSRVWSGVTLLIFAVLAFLGASFIPAK